ncbi:hypothetical protein AB0H12_13370 [Actinosynnema sp. NPDC023794]
MKRLVVVAATLLLTACESSAPQVVPPITNVSGTSGAGDAAVLDGRGIGAVRLGMSLQQLKATGEVGEEMTESAFSCPVHELETVEGWVGLHDGVAVDLRVESGARTPEGLRLGDSRARMHEVYPDVEQTPHGFVRAADRGTWLWFYFRDAGDTLTGIGLTREGHGCLN